MDYRKILLAAIQAIALSAQAQVDDATQNTYAEKSKSGIQTLSFDLGPAWVTSKMYTSRGTYTWRKGFEIGTDYSCVYSRGYGFGFSFLYNTTNYPDGKAKQLFVGPSFVYAGNFSRKWRGMAEIGLGVGYFSADFTSEMGLGVKYSTGVEYMLSDKFGINVKLRSITVYFGGKENFDSGDDDEVNGVARLAFQLGACFHF